MAVAFETGIDHAGRWAARVLTGSVIKPMIREIVGPVLAQLEFETPGVCMWRHRRLFIDVVEFRAPRQGVLQVNFGCAPRVPRLSHPRPERCGFRVQPWTGGDAAWMRFGTDETEERTHLLELAAAIRPVAEAWFSNFEDVDSARQALASNADSGRLRVFDGRPGSPAHRQLVEALNALSKNRADEDGR